MIGMGFRRIALAQGLLDGGLDRPDWQGRAREAADEMIGQPAPVRPTVAQLGDWRDDRWPRGGLRVQGGRL